MAVAAGALTCAVGVSRASVANPGQQALSRAVTQFLSDHGDLCMAKYTWPRDVTPQDREAQTNDAQQLPVLERLGLVRSRDIPVAVTAGAAVRRYWLTQKGQKYYLKKKRTTLGIHGEPEQHDGDFCVATLTLDKVIKWTRPDDPERQAERIVSYTYRIKAADWMSDSGARRVFPIADRIIRGEGKLLMTATVQLQHGKWVPVLPGQ
jgi:hypothetical protein